MKKTLTLLLFLSAAAPALAQDRPVDPLWPQSVQDTIRLQKELAEARRELAAKRLQLRERTRQLQALEAKLAKQGAELTRLRRQLQSPQARAAKPQPKAVQPKAVQPRVPQPRVAQRESAPPAPRVELAPRRVAAKPSPQDKASRAKRLRAWPKPKQTPAAASHEPASLISSEDETFTVKLKSRSGGDRTLAKTKVAKLVLTRVVGSKTASAIPRAKRLAIYKGLFDAIQRQRVRQTRRGSLIYKATLNMGEARSVVLDELGVAGQFQRSPFIVISGLKGPGSALAETASAAFGDALTKHRFRRLSASAPRTQAPLVCSIRGQIAFTPMPRGSAHAGSYRGFLRCQGVVARVFDRNTRTVLAEFVVQSSRTKRDSFEATLNKLHQPWVGKHQSVSEAAEEYAQFIGRAAATRVAQSFLATYCRARLDRGLASQPASRPLARSGRRVLRSAPQRSKHPLPSEYYELRLVGFEYDEVDTLIRTLERVRGFDNWVERGIMGNLFTYECTFRGTFIVRRLNEALEDAQLDGRVRKRGARLTITKR